MAIDPVLLQNTLRRCFGLERLRPLQQAVVESVLRGRPTLAVLPTGAGKSLCYQLPAVLLPGTAVVISPLVALMRDQVEALRRRGVAAGHVNSQQTERERQQVEQAVAEGRLSLLYAAPERFRSGAFLRLLSGVRLSLVAVDEAHCVAEWGHAFRPDYERLGEVLAELSPTRLLALTATAGPAVRAEILRSLRMSRAHVEVAAIDRPNIHLAVRRATREADRRQAMLAALRQPGQSIVYAPTRQRVERLTAMLAQAGLEVAGYHAGMSAAQRQAAQDRFASGRLPVVVATSAFGLGVDLPAIRRVVHAGLPRSLEAYYQEVGRAGRDGEAAEALLLHAPSDLFVQRHLLAACSPGEGSVQAAWSLLQGRVEPLSPDELTRRWPAQLPAVERSGALAFLEGAGLAMRAPAVRGVRVWLTAAVTTHQAFGLEQLLKAAATGEARLELSLVGAWLGCEGPAAVFLALRGLQRAGVLGFEETLLPGGLAPAPGARLSAPLLSRLRHRRLRDQRRLEQTVRYAHAKVCRRRTLLLALGESSPLPACSGCDRCDQPRGAAASEREPDEGPMSDP